MKFECDKSLLSAAIDGVSRAITNRAAIPVLEGIYLKAEGFQLTLTGYDMEMGITTNIECNVQVPGETVLEAKLFGSMVSRMPSGTVSVELNNEGMAIISGGVAEFEIPAMNASDYPSLPNTAAENTMTIPTSMMRELIEKTIYAVAVEDKKPAHTGELFVIEPGRLTVVALDGYRLAIIKRDVECTRDIRIIIPAKTLQELLKIIRALMTLNQTGTCTAFYEYYAHVGIFEITLFEGRWNYRKKPIARYNIDCRNDPLLDEDTQMPVNAERLIENMILQVQ